MNDSGGNVLLARAKWALKVLRQRRGLALSVAWGVALVSAAGISVAPERFEASARIYVDTQTVLKPLMVGLAYQPDVDQQVRMLARTLISRPNVAQLVDKPEAGFSFKTPNEREATLNRLMEQIKVIPAERGNLYTISYKDSDPVRARQIVDSTVALFMSSGIDGKKKDSAEASRFIDEQIASTEAKLTEAESLRKDFKIRNFGVSGVSNEDYFSRMSTLSDVVSKLRNDLQAAEQSRDSYRRELANEDPQLPPQMIAALPAAVVVSEIDSRLDAQRKQLDEQLRRFTEEHPDVINSRRMVAKLEEEKRRQDAAARAQDGAPRAHGTAATSPVYQKLRFALAESEAQVASLRAQLSAQQERLAQIRAVAGRAPQVEAELAQLNRDYDVVRKGYDLLVARRESASLGVKLDESSQLADFRIVEPPRVSPAPVFPGRVHLALIALVLSIAAGAAAAFATELLQPTFDDAKLLEQMSGRPVLGSISLSKTDESQRKQKSSFARFVSATALLAMLQVGFVAWVASRSIAP